MNQVSPDFSSPQIHRHFWSWDRPLLDHAVDFFMKFLSPDGVLDLSSKLILLPTRESVRRLREALAIKVGETQGALIAPHLKTAESVLWGKSEEIEISNRLQDFFIWDKALSQFDFEEYTNLFPIPPKPEMQLAWQRQTAKALLNLKQLLATGGYKISDVVESMSKTPDADRWIELAKLEGIYEKTLAELGISHELEVKSAQAQEPQLPEGVEQIYLMGVFDASVLFKKWLTQVSKRVQVDSFVYANEAYQNRFDGIGIPLIEAWSEGGSLQLELHEDQLKLVKEPKVEAEEAIDWSLAKANECGDESFSLAFAASSAELNPFLESHLITEGFRVFDPSGKHAVHHSLYKLLSLWSHFVSTEYWSDLCEFLRHPDVLMTLSDKFRTSEDTFLSRLDEFTCKSLPTGLEQAEKIASQEMSHLIVAVKKWLKIWDGNSLKDALQGFLNEIYGERTFLTSRLADKQFMSLSGSLLDQAILIDDCREKLKLEDQAKDLLTILLAEVSGEILDEARGEIDFSIQGWLELLWEPAQYLAVLGMNEEYVPGVVKGDVFLPDTERRKLGLINQKSRRARDCYLLHSIVEQRRAKGDVLFLLSRQNADGEGLKPSRLFFDVDDEELIKRVSKLFPKDTEEETSPEPATSIGFKLKPRWKEVPLERVSPSALNAYLDCPFRYYLSRHLKMRKVETDVQELEAKTFGDLLHLALKEYAVNPELNPIVSCEKLEEWLMNRIAKIWSDTFGDAPMATLILQLESAKQRLRHAASELLNLRAQGWETLYTEFDIETWGITIDGVKVGGKIDRLDRRLMHGREEFLIIDYKTGLVVDPAKAHLRRQGKQEEFSEDEEWMLFEDKFWQNLQLPLYAWCLQEKHPDAKISVGYFHLPSSVKYVGVNYWEDFGKDHMKSAVECAKGVIARLRQRIFWPPKEEVPYDEFEFLLGDPLLTINPVELTKAQESI